MKKTHNLKNTTEIILESISDGVFTVDLDWKITSFNRSAEDITGISREEAIGRHCWDVFRSNMCEGGCTLKKTMTENRAFISSVTHIINKDMKRIPINVSTSVLRDDNGNILGGVETFRDHSLVEELRKELTARFHIGDMVSQSPIMQKIFNILPLIAESESSVLIQGDTGTGKELMARAIHNASPRSNRPFIAINCGALPDTLLESELFGYKAGAFTNALKDKEGYFASAKGGTIFLDEIGETSQAFQVSLLRVLEEKSFKPLGSSNMVKSDVRIITATNRNLADMVKKGKFRQDLFYRINIVQIHLPQLRQRMEDLPLLIDYFICRLNRIQGKNVEGIDIKALERLMSHPFPGNIRELQNIIEHAFVLCSKGKITLNHLPSPFSSHSSPFSVDDTPPPQNNFNYFESIADCASDCLDRQDRLISSDIVESAQRNLIINALQKNNYNRKKAAMELGIHKSTLFRKINKLGISLPTGFDGRSSDKL
ncbi:MAG: sigma 54-interacting transcriptional regulator [Desulfamplus sp.]|nr:sigma 54-interacting transcriptional regulator [Desulfamplus sp.]